MASGAMKNIDAPTMEGESEGEREKVEMSLAFNGFFLEKEIVSQRKC